MIKIHNNCVYKKKKIFSIYAIENIISPEIIKKKKIK